MFKRFRMLLLGAALLTSLTLSSTASAFEVWAFIDVNGVALPGSVNGNPAKDGGIQLSSFAYSAARPVRSDGSPSGAAVRQPVTITKALDANSPLLYQALMNGEQITEAEFKFFRMTQTGQEEIYHEITLTNAAVISFIQTGGLSNEMEAIKLYFQRMEQTSVSGGTSFTD